VCVGTGSTPGIKSSVGEDDLGGSQVLFISDSTEVVESIVVVWLVAVGIAAVVSPTIVVELFEVEHILDSVCAHGHGLVAASKHVPSAHIVV
jgi:hypothetical protein